MWSNLVCCPVSGEKLASFEPWLWSSEQSDALYPVIAETPILQPDIDAYLTHQTSAIARGLAEFESLEEIRRWYFSRYGFFKQEEPLPMDTEIAGEGYPGFWRAVNPPAFVTDMEKAFAEGRIFEVMGDRHFERALDIGCGQGAMMQRMSAICDEVYGLERHFYLAAIGNQILRSSEVDIRYFDPSRGFRRTTLNKPAVQNAQIICGDAEAMPFREPLFDWVHCGHVLDLVNDPEEVLAAVERVLKPGGILSLCTPWDFEEAGHFDAMLAHLGKYRMLFNSEGFPYVRFQHKRRYVLHEDWLWIGVK